MHRIYLLMAALMLLLPVYTLAQETAEEKAVVDPAPLITTTHGALTDEKIQERIKSIYAQIEQLSSVNVDVKEGIVFLSGSVANEAQAKRALSLAVRMEGVVTIDDNIERSLDVQGNVEPLIEQFQSDLARWTRSTPLFALAFIVFFIIAYLGHRLAKWSTLWQRISPNPFLAELIAQAIRVISILIGLVVSLNLVGATALMGTILGGAGVAGLAIGFAVRDSMENYVSSIMLSLRQPFRANDHVVIGEHEGKVVRLTSRATILMTLDGNHLRIPNSTVFKAVILNYTTNPERRFDFELGVDADDDPIAAMKTGLDAISELPFVLKNPAPNAIISVVGDSNIILKFMAWVNQEQSDFGKARSLAIGAAKNILEKEGFTLPEPIYRLRFDTQQMKLLGGVVGQNDFEQVGATGSNPELRKPALMNEADRDEVMDVSPDTHLENKVNEERALDDESDLLDDKRPVE